MIIKSSFNRHSLNGKHLYICTLIICGLIYCLSWIRIQKQIDISLNSALCPRINHPLYTHCSKHLFFFNLQNLPLLKVCLQLQWASSPPSPRGNVSANLCQEAKIHEQSICCPELIRFNRSLTLVILSSNRDQERGGGEKRLESNGSLKGSWLTVSTFVIHSHFRICPYCNQKTAFSFFFSR